MKQLYFDHEAASFASTEVMTAKQKAEEVYFASPLAPYQLGQEALAALRRPYEDVYHLLGSSNDNTLIICSSGAEAINQVLWSVYINTTREEGKNHFITSQIDEAPTILGLERLANYFACSISQIPIDQNGNITKDALIETMSPKTALLSLSYGNGVLGTYQSLKEIITICKERGVLVHLDVTHALGKLSIDFEEMEVDFLTFHAEQIHGPKGIGALLYKVDAVQSPLVIGGAEQKGKRGGACDIPSIIGLGVAASQAVEYCDYMGTELALLRDRFEEGILEKIPDAKVHFQKTLRLPNISCISFPGLNNDALLYRLSQRGVSASFGGGNFQQISLLLEACGLEKQVARSSLSFSFCRWHTDNDIESLSLILVEEVESLKKMSSFFKG